MILFWADEGRLKDGEDITCVNLIISFKFGSLED